MEHSKYRVVVVLDRSSDFFTFIKTTFTSHRSMAVSYIICTLIAITLRIIYFIRLINHVATPVGFIMSDLFIIVTVGMSIRLYIEGVGTGFAIEEAIKAKRAAEQANEAKSRFLANMSHEIRTPINAILGMNEIILKECKDKAILGYAENILSASTGLLSLVNDILDFSKIESGEMVIVDADYETGELFNGLEVMFLPRASEKGLTFRLEVDGRIPKILHGDIMRVRQICINLLSNAIKYTDRGSVVMSVTWEREKDGNAFIIISVKDTGRGIKQQDIDGLFDKFSRADLEHNNTIEGTGLGLSITQELVEMMHGTISVKSFYGTGSVFTVKILQGVQNPEPLGDFRLWKSNSSLTQDLGLDKFIAPNAKILVVDDTELNLVVVKGLLKDTKIKIDVALSGHECLEKVKHLTYDLIILDARMPHMDGEQTLKALREQGLPSNVPVIVFTADAISGAAERYMKAGFDGYLSKPVRSDKLAKVVKDFLPADKILPCVDEAIDEKESTTFMSLLSSVEGLDINSGLDMCGSIDTYKEAIADMTAAAEDTISELGTLFTSGNIEDFTIKVHAMKSSLRLIGAAELSDLAEALENAGNRNDTMYISNNLSLLLGGYMKIMKQCDNVLNNCTENEDINNIREVIDEDAVSGIFGHLKGYVEDFNDEAVDAMLRSLSRYAFPGIEQKRFEMLIKAHNTVDWEMMSKLLDNDWEKLL